MNTTLRKTMTEAQKDFLKHNYPSHGMKWCMEKTLLSRSTIQRFCFKNNLRVSSERRKIVISDNIKKAHQKNNEKLSQKKYCNYSVDPTLFLNISEPFIVYILGLLWADGYILKKKNCDRIEISALLSDLEEVKHLFLKTGQWNTYIRTRQNRLPQLTITTNNKVLCQFLHENNYAADSDGRPNKILSLIPDNLKHYWFRGVFDGDGCLYMSKSANQCSITSDYEQNWDFLETLLISLNVKYTIKQNNRKSKNNKVHISSVLRITNKHDIKHFLNYIYQNRKEDNIGYSRKYNKYLKLLKIPDKMKTGPKQSNHE